MSGCQRGPKTSGPITRMSSGGVVGCSARRGKPGLSVPVCRTLTLGLSLGATACRNRAAAGGATALPDWWPELSDRAPWASGPTVAHRAPL